MEKEIALALCLINGLSFTLFGLDKWYAIRRRWRIPERTLLGCALLFGAGGAFLGMRLFHHKTRKPPFAVGIPLLLLLQIGLLLYWVFRL